MVTYFIYHNDTWLQLQRGKRSKSCFCQHLILWVVKEQPAVQHAYWSPLSQLAIKPGLHIRFTGICSSMTPQRKTECWIPTLLLKLLSYLASPSLANIYNCRCGSVLFTVRSLCYKACLPTVHECFYNQMWCFELSFHFCHDLDCDLSHFTVPFLMD